MRRQLWLCSHARFHRMFLANPAFTMEAASPMTSLSKLAASIVQSEIRIMSVECAKVGGVNLAQGVCDTEVPPPVRDGAIRAIENGLNSYTRLDGVTELRQAIAEKLRRDNGITVDAEREVVVTVGS